MSFFGIAVKQIILMCVYILAFALLCGIFLGHVKLFRPTDQNGEWNRIAVKFSYSMDRIL